MEPRSSFKALPQAARFTIMFFAATGLVALLSAMAYQPSFSLGRTLLFLGLAAASSRAKVNIYRGCTISFLTAVVLLGVITEGPGVTVLGAILGVSVQTLFPRKKISRPQLAFNAGMIAMTATATWWVYHFVAATHATGLISAETVATLIASFTYFLGNSISVSLIVSVTKGISAFHVWASHFVYSAPSFLIAGMLSLGLTGFAATHLTVVALVILIISVSYYSSIRLSERMAR